MLSSTLEHYRRQQRLTAMAVVEARRLSSRGSRTVAQTVITYQLASIALTMQTLPDELAEQGIVAPPEGRVSPAALVTAAPATVEMLSKTASDQAFDRLIGTLVRDAGRTASAVETARRPAVTGYVRSLNLPSCSRCAVLAGRVYRWSTGFRRHPACDCVHTPVNDSTGLDLVLDPTDAIKSGQITGLSRLDAQAVDLGADLGQVVNVRRLQAGLKVGSSVVERGGRPTPEGILRTAPDRAAALAGLTQAGYLL